MSEIYIPASDDNNDSKKRSAADDSDTNDLKKKKEALMDTYLNNSSTAPSGDSQVTSEIMEVMQDKVGQIIGSKGSVIKEIQSKSGYLLYS